VSYLQPSGLLSPIAEPLKIKSMCCVLQTLTTSSSSQPPAHVTVCHLAFAHYSQTSSSSRSLGSAVRPSSTHRIVWLTQARCRSLLVSLISLRLALFLQLAGNRSSSRPERSVLKSGSIANLLQRSVETFKVGLFCGRLWLQSINTRLETGDSFLLRGSKIEIRVLL
jgi:hypothetical protein